jgi:hypothetical protein
MNSRKNSGQNITSQEMDYETRLAILESQKMPVPKYEIKNPDVIPLLEAILNHDMNAKTDDIDFENSSRHFDVQVEKLSQRHVFKSAGKLSIEDLEKRGSFVLKNIITKKEKEYTKPGDYSFDIFYTDGNELLEEVNVKEFTDIIKHNKIIDRYILLLKIEKQKKERKEREALHALQDDVDVDPFAQMSQQERDAQIEELRQLRDRQQRPVREAEAIKSKDKIEEGERLHQAWLLKKKRERDALKKVSRDEDEEDERKENEVIEPDPRLSLQEGDEVEEEVEALGSNVQNPDDWDDNGEDDDVWG